MTRYPPHYFGSIEWQEEMIATIKLKLLKKQRLEPIERVFLDGQLWHNQVYLGYD